MNMKKIIIISIAIILTIYIGGFFFSSGAQELLIYPSPNRTNEECKRNIMDNIVIHNGTTLYHEQVEGADTVVVFYHGNANIVCDMAFVMDIFDKKGISYIFPEYIGYSKDKRKTTHEGILENVQDTVDYIEEQDYEHVYVIGQSIGSGAASYHTSLQEPEKLLLITPFTTLTNVLTDMFPIYPQIFIERFFNDRFDNVERLTNYNGDLTIVHGTKDPVIDISHSEKILEAVSAKYEKLFIADGYGHAEINESDEMVDAIENIIQ